MAAKEQVNQIGKKLISSNSSQSRLYLRVGIVLSLETNWKLLRSTSIRKCHEYS